MRCVDSYSYEIIVEKIDKVLFIFKRLKQEDKTCFCICPNLFKPIQFSYTHSNLKDFDLSSLLMWACRRESYTHIKMCKIFYLKRGNTRLSLENIYLLQFSCMNVPCVPWIWERLCRLFLWHEKRQKFYCCNIEFKKSFRNRKLHKENDVETV